MSKAPGKNRLLTSPPTATVLPVTATELGVYLGFNSCTFWLDRIASTPLTSAMKTVESLAIARDFGCDDVAQDA